MKDLREYINKLSYDFSSGSFDEKDAARDPLVQFEKWFREAVTKKVPAVNAMVVATASASGVPSSRIVLLRNFGEEGFIFYTNYKSHKARDLSENPRVSLTFFWPLMERQVHIKGKIKKQDAVGSDLYFAARRRASQVGAWASPQSKPVKDRDALDKLYVGYEKKFEDQKIPRPAHWGGYVVEPLYFEFWQGRPGRFHDRIVYRKKKNKWNIQRIAP